MGSPKENHHRAEVEETSRGDFHSVSGMRGGSRCVWRERMGDGIQRQL